MDGVRAPAVAGTFYPGQASALTDTVDALLRAAGPPEDSTAPKAIVVPHAGYVYSGPVAARAYQAVSGLKGRLKRVVLIGPAHYVAFEGLAVPRCQAFGTPLGALPVDHAAIEDLTDVILADRPHEPEHSLEVQLPFLQRCLGEVAIVPILAGRAETARVAALIDRLWDGAETLVVVSSDLSHYHSYDQARRLDQATAASIEALDDAPLGPKQACGFCPLAGLLQVARRRRLNIKRLDLRNSGDTAGPRDQVVGYGAWALFEPG